MSVATRPAAPAHAPSAEPYYYLRDGQGWVTAITDPSGATVVTYGYDPYGQLTNMIGGNVAINNPWRYVGAYQDGTGLYHMGARYYDPSTGRFTQPDPAGTNPLDPGSWNPYVYTGGDPINYADLNGLKRHWWDSVGCWVGHNWMNIAGVGLGAASILLSGGLDLPYVIGLGAAGLGLSVWGTSDAANAGDSLGVGLGLTGSLLGAYGIPLAAVGALASDAALAQYANGVGNWFGAIGIGETGVSVAASSGGC